MSADTKPSLNAPHGQLRTTRRRLLAGAGAVAAAAAVAPLAVACQQQPTSKKSGPAKVVVMTDSHEFGDDDRKLLQDTTKIEIELVEADLTRLYAMYAAGNPPDIFRVQAAGIPQYISRRMLKDLQPYFANSKVLKIDDLAPANNFYKSDGKKVGTGDLYGMVKDWSPDFTLYAYKKPFAEAGVTVPSDSQPLTYDELAAIAKKVNKKQGGKRTYWGFVHSNNDQWIDRTAMNMLAEKNQSLYSADFSKLVIATNPETLKVVRYLFDLAKDDVHQNPLDPSPNWMGADFNEGQIAILQYGFWYSAMAESDKTKGNVVFLPAPTWSGVRRDPTMTATGWVISSQTKDPDAAWAVFEQYMGGKPAQDRAKSGWGVPGLKSMYPLMPQETPFQKQVQKVLQAELKQSEFTLAFNPYIGEETFATSWKKHLEPALKGSISFDKFVANIEADINTAIADGKRIAGNN
ncbi:MAG: extracellular solute-binding protein [Chloroflexi bacterium]|nr:MAG: extracellular solute-binding protein [Chloroflexota bacterium]